MQIRYDPAVIRQLMGDTEQVAQACARARDQGLGAWNACTAQYTRVSGRVQQALHRARSRMEAARYEAGAASAEYSAAMAEANASDEEDDRGDAMARAESARLRMLQAQQELEVAEAQYRDAQAKQQELSALWSQYQPQGSRLCRSLEDESLTCSRLTAQSTQDLGQYMAQMEQARAALYSGASEGAAAGGAGGFAAPAAVGAVAAAAGVGSGAAAAVTGAVAAVGAVAAAAAGGSASGWCPKSSFQAVSVGSGGQKQCAMTIGGTRQTFPCNKSGFAKAHRAAVAAGDPEMIARTGAMFELETLRRDLELTEGFSSVPQLGGYHRDVKGQDPKGYESHHIPARSVQDENADWLPAISISAEDHEKTFSYRGKQNRVTQPYFPGSRPGGTYKQEISAQVAKGSSGYVHAVRCELFDLRLSTGHKYDGGISAFLDAAIDMIATRGIPESK